MTQMAQMNADEKKLVQLRTTLRFYKKLDKKLDKVLDGTIEIEDWAREVYFEINALDEELTQHKQNMDLPDERWDEDEDK